MSGEVVQSNTYDTGAQGFLSANGVWEGAAQNVLAYTNMSIFSESDVASAASGLQIQFSPDGVTWGYQETYSVLASTPLALATPTYAKFFRLRYTNGGSNQTRFSLQTIGRTGMEPLHSSCDSVISVVPTTTISAAGTTTLSTVFVGGERCRTGNMNIFWGSTRSVAGTSSDSITSLIDMSFDGVKWMNCCIFDTLKGDAAESKQSAYFSVSSDRTTVTSDVVAGTGDVTTISAVREVMTAPYVRARTIMANVSTTIVFVYSVTALLY